MQDEQVEYSDEITRLSIAEAHNVLVHVRDSRRADEKELSQQQSVNFEKCLTYCERFDRYHSKEALAKIRSELMRDDFIMSEAGPLTDLEITLLINLSPDNPEEATALIKSLARYHPDEVEKMLMELAKYHE
eukprot:EC788546.1.p1 GENE.EC788546.1~~EC788546.1.p1  ORF type:complete len:132 (+),score=46.53 EC788546.1:34-429(+)